jgi:hypothetical protein
MPGTQALANAMQRGRGGLSSKNQSHRVSKWFYNTKLVPKSHGMKSFGCSI